MAAGSGTGRRVLTIGAVLCAVCGLVLAASAMPMVASESPANGLLDGSGSGAGDAATTQQSAVQAQDGSAGGSGSGAGTGGAEMGDSALGGTLADRAASVDNPALQGALYGLASLASLFADDSSAPEVARGGERSAGPAAAGVDGEFGEALDSSAGTDDSETVDGTDQSEETEGTTGDGESATTDAGDGTDGTESGTEAGDGETDGGDGSGTDDGSTDGSDGASTDDGSTTGDRDASDGDGSTAEDGDGSTAEDGDGSTDEGSDSGDDSSATDGGGDAGDTTGESSESDYSGGPGETGSDDGTGDDTGSTSESGDGTASEPSAAADGGENGGSDGGAGGDASSAETEDGGDESGLGDDVPGLSSSALTASAVALALAVLGYVFYAREDPIGTLRSLPGRLVSLALAGVVGCSQAVERAVGRLRGLRSIAELPGLVAATLSDALSSAETRLRDVTASLPVFGDAAAAESDPVAETQVSARERIRRAFESVIDASPMYRASAATATPAEVAHRARNAGAPREPVETITDSFRDVEYGDRDPESYLERTTAAHDRLRSALETDVDGTDGSAEPVPDDETTAEPASTGGDTDE